MNTLEVINNMNEVKNEMIRAMHDEMCGQDLTKMSTSDINAFVVVAKALDAYTKAFEMIIMKLDVISDKVING